MQKKIKISIAAVAAIMLVVLMVNLALAATSTANVSVSEANSLEKISQDDGVIISAEQAEDLGQLKEIAPTTPEEAESSIYPKRSRFLVYTHNGVHIIWGVYGNGRFAGTDNLGKRCWGIYGRSVFAGFYDGEFFWGRYNSGTWKAEYLFGLQNSWGKYVLFPQLAITSNNAAIP